MKSIFLLPIILLSVVVPTHLFIKWVYRLPAKLIWLHLLN
jgi:hypothetical protein